MYIVVLHACVLISSWRVHETPLTFELTRTSYAYMFFVFRGAKTRTVKERKELGIDKLTKVGQRQLDQMEQAMGMVGQSADACNSYHKDLMTGAAGNLDDKDMEASNCTIVLHDCSCFLTECINVSFVHKLTFGFTCVFTQEMRLGLESDEEKDDAASLHPELAKLLKDDDGSTKKRGGRRNHSDAMSDTTASKKCRMQMLLAASIESINMKMRTADGKTKKKMGAWMAKADTLHKEVTSTKDKAQLKKLLMEGAAAVKESKEL